MPDHRLTKTKPKPNNEADGTVTMRVSPPQVKVGSPVVNLKMDPPQFNMDSKAFADALESLAIAINQLGQQQAVIAQQIAESNKLMAQLAGNPPNVKVDAPKITMPSRPRSYSVEIEDEKGDVTTMTIEANSPN